MSILAIHGGACMKTNTVENKNILKTCKNAVKLDNMIEAVKVLELDDNFNCGFGSSLTIDGDVECEASYMSSEKLRFGGIGCVSNMFHPAEAAFLLSKDDWWRKSQLLHPLVLVGEGAEQYAEKKGLKTCSMADLISEKAAKQYEACKTYLEKAQIDSHDTVGAISISNLSSEVGSDVIAEAATSSGGIIMKSHGRLGQSCVFGSGCWAEKKQSFDQNHCLFGEKIITTCSTGHGEALIKTDFCRSLSKRLLNSNDDCVYADVVSNFILENFEDQNDKFGGIALIADRTDDGMTTELLIFHNCRFLPVAVRHQNGKVQKFMSTLTDDQKFVVESVFIT